MKKKKKIFQTKGKDISIIMVYSNELQEVKKERTLHVT